MQRISLFVLLALLVGSPIAHVQAQPQIIAKGDQTVFIGDTKAQVKAKWGEPTRRSKDGNTWWYGGFEIHFDSKGKVDRTGGAA